MRELTGRRFGRLTAVRAVGQTGDWVCRCSCGRLVTAPAAQLLSGVKTSCGCARTRALDLTGQRFGYLTAVYPVEERGQDQSIRWLCRCDCGKQITVSSNLLRMGRTKSCSCRAYSMTNASKTYVDGTCVEILLSDKLRKNNTSGRTGVARKRNGWQAYLTYGGKQRSLGTFPTKEAAIEAREKAEASVKEQLDRLLQGETNQDNRI